MSNDTNSVTCLLVDDLEENLVALEALLRREGLVILKARTGDEALELLLTNEVALALLDVQMPGMDGFELAEFMRRSERSRHVPIIFLTAGSADQQRRFRGYEAGAVDFIQKPIEADILRSKVNVFFDLFRQRQQILAQKSELEALTQSLQASDRRKNRFLAILGHELRNPIMGLGAGVQILQRHKDEKTLELAHSQMNRYIKHLSRLVEDLLDIARIDQGKISLKREHVNLQEILAFAVDASQHQIEAANHKLVLDISEEPIVLTADSARIAQIVSNLLLNAAKYTPAGGEIRLMATRSGDWAQIDVSDTGLGIPPEMQAKVFELFTQVESVSGSKQDGLGIGLALVKQLVELHEGRISLETSIPGVGSVFRVCLPA